MSSGNISDSSGNPYGIPDSLENPYITSTPTETGTVQNIPSQPSVGSTGSIALQQDTQEQSTQMEEHNNPESSIPFLQQPEVQQAILSNPEMMKALLLAFFQSNFNVSSGSTPNNSVSGIQGGVNAQGLQAFAQLYGLDPTTLGAESAAGLQSSQVSQLFGDFNKQMNEIINASWDKFNQVLDDLKKQAEAYLRSGAKAYLDYIRSPKYQDLEWNKAPQDEKVRINQGAAQFEQFLKSLPAQSREDLIAAVDNNRPLPDSVMKFTFGSNLQAFGQAFSQAAQTNGAGFNVLDATFLAGLAIMNTAGVQSYAIGNAEVTQSTTVKIIQDSMNSSNSTVPLVGIDSNTAATLGYLGGLIASGMAFYPALHNATSTQNDGKRSPQSVTLDFAKSYAHATQKFVFSDGFAAGIMAIVTQRSDNTTQLNDDQKTEIVNRVRVLLLANALGVLQKAAGNKFEGADLLEAVNNPDRMKALPDISNQAYGLARDINTSLPRVPGTNQIDRAKADAVLRSLADYYDTKPSNDDLLETNNAVQAAYSLNDRHESIVAKATTSTGV